MYIGKKKNTHTHTDIVYENFSQKKNRLYYSVGNFTQKLRKKSMKIDIFFIKNHRKEKKTSP